MKLITTVLIEPQPIFLRGLVQELKEATDIEVLATASTGREGISLVREHHPMTAVIAIRTAERLRVVEELQGATNVLILTQEADNQDFCECMVAGAQGYLLKEGSFELADAIHEMYDGNIVMSQDSLNVLVAAVRAQTVYGADDESGTKLALLTSREREVMQLICEGARQEEIAARLVITPTTVKTHRRNIYKKLAVSSSIQAVRAVTTGGIMLRRRGG